jgi:hypothetical protein
MSFPKKGKFFPDRGSGKSGEGLDNSSLSEASFADAISTALDKELGMTRAAVKTLVGWTGAHERTVKNWLSGRYGPSGVHLVALMRQSDLVLKCVLDMAGRGKLSDATRLAEVEAHLLAALNFVRRLDD